MALLAEVFLGDLKLDGFIGLVKIGKQGRCRFPYLEINGSMLDLDDDVVVELAVERLKNFNRCFGAVGLSVMPVEMMVVD